MGASEAEAKQALVVGCLPGPISVFFNYEMEGMGLRTRAFRSLDRRRFFTIVLFYPEKGIELSFFASRGTSLLIPLVNHVFDESSFDSLSYYRFFSRSDFLVVLYQPGHRTELQAGITSIQSYLSWSPNHIDRDRVTANRDEEKVSSVTID